MSISAIIVDDDPTDSNNLKVILTAVGGVSLKDVCRNVRDAVDAIKHYQPTLLFLDIDLGMGETGFEVLRQFKKPTFSVIFTTHHHTKNNLLNALRASAFDFLHKPLLAGEVKAALALFNEKNEEELKQRFDVLQGNMNEADGRLSEIVIANIGVQTKIEIANIKYCKAENVSTLFYLATPVLSTLNNQYQTKIISPYGIGEWEKTLGQSNIIRSHNSYLVNLRYTAQYKIKADAAAFILKDGSEVPVSKGRKENVREKWKSYYR